MARGARQTWGWAGLLAAALTAGSARADTQLWTLLEARMPLSDGSCGLPTEARWVTESRYFGTNGGLNYLLLRVGPGWTITPWLRLNLNGVAATTKSAPSTYRQQFRVEIEPNLQWTLGSFEFNDRQRLERRWIIDDTSWIYRNQLRVDFRKRDAVWIPLITEEVFFNLVEGGFVQNRLGVGIAWISPRRLRVEVGYLWRTSRAASGWRTTQVIACSFSFQPDVESVIQTGPL